jgi:hypothetical protein
MEFLKATIAPEGQDSFDVLFNPNQYGINASNQIAQAGIPGLAAPILQFVHGNSRSLTMDLYFDTYERQSDVREHTDKIYRLLAIDHCTHVPPICRVSWGTFYFRCVVSRVSGKFTLFLSNGTPARATLNVTFEEFIEPEVLVQEDPTQSADHRKTRVVEPGDRLDHIAAREYGDANNWRPIADANQLDNPRSLTVGQLLIIPALTHV